MTDTLSQAAILVITVGSSVRAVIPSLIKEKGIKFDDVTCNVWTHGFGHECLIRSADVTMTRG